MRIDDIEGTKAIPKIRPLVVANKCEIERSTSKKLTRSRNANYSSADYHDVYTEKFVSNRHTNPLNPVYEIKNSKEHYLYGSIDKSQPNGFSNYKTRVNNLTTFDIDGTQIGSKNKYNKLTSNNFNLNVTDIDKTKTGSYQRGIVSLRNTSPLDPIYVLPGKEGVISFDQAIFNKSSTKVKELETHLKLNRIAHIKETETKTPHNVDVCLNRPVMKKNASAADLCERNYGLLRDKYIMPALLQPSKSRLSEFHEDKNKPTHQTHKQEQLIK